MWCCKCLPQEILCPHLITSPRRTLRLLRTTLFMRIFSSEQVSSDRTMQTASLLFFPLSRTVSPLNSCSSSIFACKQQNVTKSFWKKQEFKHLRVIWLWKLHPGSDTINPEDRDSYYSGTELPLYPTRGRAQVQLNSTNWGAKNILSRRSVRKQDNLASTGNSCTFWHKHLYSCCKVTFQVNRQQQLANY